LGDAGDVGKAVDVGAGDTLAVCGAPNSLKPRRLC
jgi:hypothetical protein